MYTNLESRVKPLVKLITHKINRRQTCELLMELLHGSNGTNIVCSRDVKEARDKNTLPERELWHYIRQISEKRQQRKTTDKCLDIIKKYNIMMANNIVNRENSNTTVDDVINFYWETIKGNWRVITKRDYKFLNLAKVVSTYSDYKRIHIGAVVAKGTSLISTGCNRSKSNPLQKEYDMKCGLTHKTKSNLHAEIDALLKANKEAYNATLYVYRLRRDGILGICKPCAACTKYAKDLGIKRIVYTVNNGVEEYIF